jgi:hypothetical protein
VTLLSSVHAPLLLLLLLLRAAAAAAAAAAAELGPVVDGLAGKLNPDFGIKTC